MYCVPQVGVSRSHAGGDFRLQEMSLVSQDHFHCKLFYFSKHRLARSLTSFLHNWSMFPWQGLKCSFVFCA